MFDSSSFAAANENSFEAYRDGVKTFRCIAKAWLDRESINWSPRHKQIIRSSFHRDIYPDLADRPITEITPKELFGVLQKVERRGAYDIVKRLTQRCAQVFLYGILIGECSSNPANGLFKAFKKPQVRHRPALSQRNLPKFWHDLANYSGSAIVRIAFQLLVITFVRPGELRNARWDEFDLEKRIWIIPAARMKMRREHMVPLCPLAIGLLQELRPITGHQDILFPGPWTKYKPISDTTLLRAIKILGFQGMCVPHGFRATAASILSENEFAVDAIERQLAHLEQDKVKAPYHRAEFLKQRREMMEWWGAYLASL